MANEKNILYFQSIKSDFDTKLDFAIFRDYDLKIPRAWISNGKPIREL